jgi:hypothetical protein
MRQLLVHCKSKHTSKNFYLTNQEFSIGSFRIRGKFHVGWRWAFANSAADVVMRPVARAEPAVVFAGIRQRNTSKMRADSNDNQPTKQSKDHTH